MSGCLRETLPWVLIAAMGPWLVSLAAAPLTGALAEALAWLGGSGSGALSPRLAIADFTEAIEHDMAEPFVYHDRAFSHYNNGDHQLAIADYSKALSLDPNYAQAYANRCGAYAASGDYTNAWADVKACQDLTGIIDPEFLAKLREDSGTDG